MRAWAWPGASTKNFLKQLDAGHLGLALTYAASLKIDLADARRLCQLMAKDGDERFSPRCDSMGRAAGG